MLQKNNLSNRDKDGRKAPLEAPQWLDLQSIFKTLNRRNDMSWMVA
jgi:hypothetical protein